MIRHAITYKNQPDFLAPAGVMVLMVMTSPVAWFIWTYWERHITWLEDERIREVGLGGPDTATRAQVVWQVKTNPNVPGQEGDDIPNNQSERLHQAILPIS